MLHHLKGMPADSTMALVDMCRDDNNPNKIDLGVGVYKNNQGETPILKVVKAAEHYLLKNEVTKTYVSPTGNVDFRQRMLELIVGSDRADSMKDRFATCQAAGGSGALSIGADLVQNASKNSTVWVCTPTWVNHFPLIGSNGLTLREYPYYDSATMSLLFDDMLNHLELNAKAGDVVVLHGCCHNPTGVDFDQDQWRRLTQFLLEKNLLPFVDLAYFGLGHGLEADTLGLGVLLDNLPEVIIAASCSKNFAIYRERVGFFAALCRNSAETKNTQSNLGAIQRRMISMPPNHGAGVVSHVLGDASLRKTWLDELQEMRERVGGLRVSLSQAFKSHSGGEEIASAIKNQNGMFSLLPITAVEANVLRNEHSIYLTDDGRINIAGANAANIERLAQSVMTVLS